MAHGTIRGCAAFCHFMIFTSAIIVTGIVSWFLSKDHFRDTHIIYMEVIVCIQFLLYTLLIDYYTAGSNYNTCILSCNDRPYF